MNLLLDTCSFIWFYAEPPRLSARASSLLLDPRNTVWLSTVSVWEIVVKAQSGKLPMTGDIEQIVNDQVRVNGVRLLPVDYHHVLAGRNLPRHHNDPFDRLLVCQAIAEQFTLLTPDAHIQRYPVPTEW